MASCEHCWEESGGSPNRYAELIKIRKCTPEEQAGRDASVCPKCGRKTVHQYCNVCMVPECDYQEEETYNNTAYVSVQKPAPTDEERREAAKAVEDALYNAEHWDDPSQYSQSFLCGLRNARSLILSPPKVSVSRERFESACEKFSGHWAGTLDDVRRLGRSILGDLGIAVVDREEGKK